jgi:hypothetical protein
VPEELFEEEDGCITDRDSRIIFKKCHDGYIRNSFGYPVGVVHHGGLYFQEEKLNFEEREKVWNDSVNCRKNYYLKRKEKEERPTVVKKEVEPKSNKETRNSNFNNLNFDAYNSDPKNIAIRDLSVQLYNEQKRAEEEKNRAKEILREQRYAKASRLGKFVIWFDKLTETLNDGWNNR